MTYKAFEDYYKESAIKHLLLEKHGDDLISPPFGTELCKNYSKIAFYDGKKIEFKDLKLPAATSKFNAIASVEDSSWLVPYGIWDNVNVALQITGRHIDYHTIDTKGKGQFYSLASSGTAACSFPLGYSDTQFMIYIDKNGIRTVDFKTDNTKCHMGTVYCNGKFYSMPRGDKPNYNELVSYDGERIKKYKVDCIANTRNYTDIVTIGNTLYSLPFGESSGTKELIRFDTDTEKLNYTVLNIPDFAKKFNCAVRVEEYIIGLPYGSEYTHDSNWGIIYNTITDTSYAFDIGLNFGGKYRFRSGIEYKGRAVFLPTGSVNCPIMSVGTDGSIQIKYFENVLFGRPLLHNDLIYTMAFDIRRQKSFIVTINEDLELFSKIDIA